MIVTLMQLYCDSHTAVHFPEDGAVDAAIMSHAQLRKEAQRVGWRRTRGAAARDLCPQCAGTIEPRK
jgi:hypothetical protein